MSATSSLSVRTEILKWSFALYGCLSLVSMAAMNIGAGLVGLALLFYFQTPRKLILALKASWNHRPTRIYIQLSLFLAAACLLSLIVSEFFPVDYDGNSAGTPPWVIAKFWYLLWPWLLVVGLRQLSLKEVQFVLKFWLGTFALFSVFGIFQFFQGWPKYQRIPSDLDHYHVFMLLGHHLSVASIFIFPFFSALDLAFKEKTKSFVHVAFVFAGFVALFLTYSRTLWIALPAGLILWMFWTLQKKTRWVALSVILISSIAVIQLPSIRNRVHDALGIGPRKALWEANFDFLKKRPLTGVGWRKNHELSAYYFWKNYHVKDMQAGHAHNNLIDMLGGTGLIGALAWLAWCTAVIWILFQKKVGYPSIEFSRGLLCAWVTFHINGLTQMNYWEGKVEHQMAWVIAWSLLWTYRS